MGISIERKNQLATVVLNRPDKLNALTKTMWQQLGETFRTLREEAGLRCVILQGAGERAFSAGNDISEFETERRDYKSARVYGSIMRGTFKAITECPHPIVAMVQGVCVGGGLEIAALCDIRVCGQSSRFGIPVNRLGLVMSLPELQGLVNLVGRATALEILLEGRVFGAEEATRKGLVHRVVPDARVPEVTHEVATRICAGAPLVARWHKKFINRLAQSTPITEDEIDEGYKCFDTEDFRRGYKAFLNKTKPKFVGE